MLIATLVATSSFFVACKKETPKTDTTAITQEISQENSKAETKTTDETESKSVEEFVENVGNLVKTNWPHMDKVWPGYNYNDHNFVLFYLDDEGENVKDAWLLSSTGTRKLEEKEFSGITPPSPGGYSQIKFEGKESIAMSIDDFEINQEDSVGQLYRTATHELVHFNYQDKIVLDGESNRYQVFPIDKEPRLVRRMLFTRLIEAFENPDNEDEYLGKAKFWLDKYNTEHKEEANMIRATDIAEATARYSENLSMVIGKNLSPEEQTKEVEKDIMRTEIFTSADTESYELGYVAALVLDRKSPDWKNNFYETGKNVEEVLLENVKPIEDTVDSKIEDELSKEINTVNEEVEKALENVISSIKDKSVPYLHIDTTDRASSFTAESMHQYDGTNALSKYSNRFETQGKTINIKSTSVLDANDETNEAIRVPLTMEHEVKDGVLTVNSENLKVDGVKVETSQEDGRIIYSLKVEK